MQKSVYVLIQKHLQDNKGEHQLFYVDLFFISQNESWFLKMSSYLSTVLVTNEKTVFDFNDAHNISR